MIEGSKQHFIGVDLGGTKVKAGLVSNGHILRSHRELVPAQGSVDEVIDILCHTIAHVLEPSVSGIGIGVPSVVDTESGIVYDVQNIPSWKEVPLKEILQDKFGLPVAINNDVNCFALGENHFGLGREFDHFVTLIIGTGIAAGIVINNQIYPGRNCGAGEIGMINYLDHHFEYYASGQFFENLHNTTGEEQFHLAMKNNVKAKSLFKEFGTHIGNVVKAVLYTYDPQLIILGGSVIQAFHLFESSMMQTIQTFAYRPVLDNLMIKLSRNPDIGILGASALHYQTTRFHESHEPQEKTV